MDISCVVQSGQGGTFESSRVNGALFEITRWSSSVAPRASFTPSLGFFIINSIAGTKGQDARPLPHPDIGYSIGTGKDGRMAKLIDRGFGELIETCSSGGRGDAPPTGVTRRVRERPRTPAVLLVQYHPRPAIFESMMRCSAHARTSCNSNSKHYGAF